jgi:hypothetical protein
MIHRCLATEQADRKQGEENKLTPCLICHVFIFSPRSFVCLHVRPGATPDATLFINT